MNARTTSRSPRPADSSGNLDEGIVGARRRISDIPEVTKNGTIVKKGAFSPGKSRSGTLALFDPEATLSRELGRSPRPSPTASPRPGDDNKYSSPKGKSLGGGRSGTSSFLSVDFAPARKNSHNSPSRSKTLASDSGALMGDGTGGAQQQKNVAADIVVVQTEKKKRKSSSPSRKSKVGPKRQRVVIIGATTPALLAARKLVADDNLSVTVLAENGFVEWDVGAPFFLCNGHFYPQFALSVENDTLLKSLTHPRSGNMALVSHATVLSVDAELSEIVYEEATIASTPCKTFHSGDTSELFHSDGMAKTPNALRKSDTVLFHGGDAMSTLKPAGSTDFESGEENDSTTASGENGSKGTGAAGGGLQRTKTRSVIKFDYLLVASGTDMGSILTPNPSVTLQKRAEEVLRFSEALRDETNKDIVIASDGGALSVELAGCVREVVPAEVRVLLAVSGEQLMPAEKHAHFEKQLVGMHVDVEYSLGELKNAPNRLAECLLDFTNESLHFANGGDKRADIVIPCASRGASTGVLKRGDALDVGGRVKVSADGDRVEVNEFLQSKTSPNVFAAGACSSHCPPSVDVGDELLMRGKLQAEAMALLAATNIQRARAGKRLLAYTVRKPFGLPCCAGGEDTAVGSGGNARHLIALPQQRLPGLGEVFSSSARNDLYSHQYEC